MDLKSILLYVLIAVIIYLVYYYFFVDKTSSNLLSLHNGKIKKSINANALSGSSATSDYGYSLWVYINDWDYQYGNKKSILRRKSSNNLVGPHIYLGRNTNNLHVEISTASTTGVSNSPTETCILHNVPIQKWCHIVLTTNNKTVDLYLDGKLVKTCVLNGVPRMSTIKNSPVEITPDNGFSGFLSNLKYYSRSLNPREVTELYQEGYGGSFLSALFNRYKVKFAVLKDNNELTSLQL
mgnify:CR=1 FL=1